MYFSTPLTNGKMKLDDMTDLFCLSSVLFILSVKSLTNCPSGWFGSQCKYKCRCVNDTCDASGQCTGSNTCTGGWFGPACQYADLAFSADNLSTLTDGDDSTCDVDPDTDKTSVILQEPTFFTWLRIRVTDDAENLGHLFITFGFDLTELNCTDSRKQLVDNTTLDVHCTLTENVDQVNVNGEAAGHLCSVYVSGGRNVALKEKAVQDSTYSKLVKNKWLNFSADLAVDGDTSPAFWVTLTCSHTYGTPTWTLVLSRPRSVNRYVLYNRNDSEPQQLRGFSLQSYDSRDSSTFAYTDRDPEVKIKYTIIHPSVVIEIVDVTANNTRSLLILCEVEVYGDSVCDAGYYGRECDLTCSCPYSQSCFVATGGCPTGCPIGFEGDGCRKPCHEGQYGTNCNSTCSQNCLPYDSENIPACNHVNGVCLLGCRAGFYGSDCQAAQSTAYAASGSHVELIVGLCVLMGATFFVGYCFIARRKVRSMEESTADYLQQAVADTAE